VSSTRERDFYIFSKDVISSEDFGEKISRRDGTEEIYKTERRMSTLLSQGTLSGSPS